MMNQRNIWRKITALLLLGLLLLPVLAQENELAITAKQNLALQSRPDYDSDVLGVFQRGAKANAFGRSDDGGWLHIAEGWVIAKNVDAAGDVMTLPVTTNAVTVKAASKRSLRSGPDDSFDVTGDLPSGETALALGRNGDGSWLEVSGGWLPAGLMKISGDVMALPITFSSITITANQNAALHRGPSRDTEVDAILERGESLIATSRNEAGTALQTPKGWVFINRGLALDGEVMDLPPAPTVSVTAAQALTLYRRPSHDSNRQAVVQRDEQAIAFGRAETGTWLEIPGGWIFAEQGLELGGDIMDLPVTSGESSTQSIAKTSPRDGVTITPANSFLTVRGGPSIASDIVGRLQSGEEAVAIGRNEAGRWLQIEDGWLARLGAKADGDIMSLPVTSGESSRAVSSTTTSARQATLIPGSDCVHQIRAGDTLSMLSSAYGVSVEEIANANNISGRIKISINQRITIPKCGTTGFRPPPTSAAPSASASAFSEQTIRSRVNRYTDDIRILKITQRGSTTHIEYDLKPWPFVPNESIANEVMFKVICALRRGGQIPHKLEFVGQGHFKSDVGRKFKSPSVETHISASNANRIICSGNSDADINWRRLTLLYRSYPIPSGASVDYD